MFFKSSGRAALAEILLEIRVTMINRLMELAFANLLLVDCDVPSTPFLERFLLTPVMS